MQVSTLIRSLSWAASFFFGILFPAWGSVNAIESVSEADDTQWLTYWLCYSILLILERSFWFILQWVPGYSLLKAGVLAWLVLPQTKGATYVYEAFLSPAFRRARQELSKTPALQSAVDKVDQLTDTSGAPTTVDTDISEYSQRVAKTVNTVQSAFEQNVKNAYSISDPVKRTKTLKTLDKNMSKVQRIASQSGTGLLSAFGSTATSKEE